MPLLCGTYKAIFPYNKASKTIFKTTQGPQPGLNKYCKLKARKVVIQDEKLRITMINGLSKFYPLKEFHLLIETEVVDASNVNLTKELCAFLQKFVKSSNIFICNLKEDRPSKETFEQLLKKWQLEKLEIVALDESRDFGYDTSCVEKVEIKTCPFLFPDVVLNIQAKKEVNIGSCVLGSDGLFPFLTIFLVQDKSNIKKSFKTQITPDDFQLVLKDLPFIYMLYNTQMSDNKFECVRDKDSWVIRLQEHKLKVSIEKDVSISIRPVYV